jgi:hypothetical protein
MANDAADLLLSPEEVKRVSGGYTQAAKQLEELLRQGFWRARRARVTGEIILERAHYEAVCAGRDRPVASWKAESSPELMPP